MPPRTRRPTAEIRRLLIESAARVFTEKGFADATADDIAADAGVARSAIWRHFSDKSDLFGAAVLQPFVEFLENYSAAYAEHQQADWDDVEITRTIVALFYDSCMAHREALVGVAVAGRSLDDETVSQLEERFDSFFREVMRTTNLEADRRGWVRRNGLDLTMRLLFGAVASAVVFDRPLISSGDNRPSREAVIDHLTRLFLYGARLDLHRADPSAP